MQTHKSQQFWNVLQNPVDPGLIFTCLLRAAHSWFNQMNSLFGVKKSLLRFTQFTETLHRLVLRALWVNWVSHEHLAHTNVLNIPECIKDQMSPGVCTEFFVVGCIGNGWVTARAHDRVRRPRASWQLERISRCHPLDDKIFSGCSARYITSPVTTGLGYIIWPGTKSTIMMTRAGTMTEY